MVILMGTLKTECKINSCTCTSFSQSKEFFNSYISREGDIFVVFLMYHITIALPIKKVIAIINILTIYQNKTN